jgi:hypothetical protein
MTRALRRRHLALWIVIAPLALATLIAALLVREPSPAQAAHEVRP